MTTPFKVYMGLCLTSWALLTLLLPFVLLPGYVTGVPARDFGIIHGSIVIAALAKSAFVGLEILISKDTTPYAFGGRCDVDAAATALLTMAVVAHFPLLAINTHFKVTTRDNPPQKLFSTLWSLLLVFVAYTVSALVGIGMLVTWGAESGMPLGAWVDIHCVPTLKWWRIARIVSLFIPLTLAIIISIPCVLSVTIRHHLFRRRDVTNTRIEVGALLVTCVAAMCFLISVWAKPLSRWPRPLEGALGILVFIMVLSESVIITYARWAIAILPIKALRRWARRRRHPHAVETASEFDIDLMPRDSGDKISQHDDEKALGIRIPEFGAGNAAPGRVSASLIPPTLPPLQPVSLLHVSLPSIIARSANPTPLATPTGTPTAPIHPASSSTSSLNSKNPKNKNKNKILPVGDMKDYISRIRPVSAISSRPSDGKSTQSRMVPRDRDDKSTKSDLSDVVKVSISVRTDVASDSSSEYSRGDRHYLDGLSFSEFIKSLPRAFPPPQDMGFGIQADARTAGRASAPPVAKRAEVDVDNEVRVPGPEGAKVAPTPMNA